MIILGINAYHGDASAAIIADGKLIAAAEEERFNRIKHSAGFPGQAVRYCLKEAGVAPDKIDYVAVPRQPCARIIKKIYYGIKVPRLAARRYTALKMTRGIKTDLAGSLGMDEKLIRARFVNIEHHRAHLASSFFVSPFDKALVFSADGLGDFASTMWGIGEGNKLKITGDICFPYSLGLYYTAITQYLGFPAYGDEYKVMGLAAYGEPEYRDEFKEIVFEHGDLGFKLGLDYFLHHKKLVDMNFEEGYPSLEPLYSGYLEARLGPARKSPSPIERKHYNIAASLQGRLEEIIFGMLNGLSGRINLKDICMSGGVAFNCVANGKILSNTGFRDVYIPPAAGDAGLAIGGAFYLWYHLLNNPRSFTMEHAYWGPAYKAEDVSRALESQGNALNKEGCKITRISDEDQLCRSAAKAIAEAKVVGWFQGRMEWGPRALGNRSIFVDPRRKEMKDLLNSRVKHREPFRPFAPSVLEERTSEYFEGGNYSPFMLFAYKVRPEKKELIPAVTHVDDTARVQTVSRRDNPLFWQLISEFDKLTGVPVLLNTSFNDNEPVVNSPREAVECFLRTKMDILVMENFFIEK
ncbi:MAG: carbamoyltransferase [Candidatus Omnitrophica bacterium]|nr:carbamoyltransferase [Candidatus Omnitrophota bacterium]